MASDLEKKTTSDEETKVTSDLEKKIIKQIDYYFGDYNLPKDKFLKEQTTLNDGWVDLKVLLTFQRLASISNDAEVIAKAVQKSETGLVVVSEDLKRVRRNPEKPSPELTDERKKEIIGRTAYAKGFPLDEPRDDIEKFFDGHGMIESCFKRTFLDKATKEHKFKGSCFVVFKNVDDCKKFVEATSITYKDTELIRKYQADYIEEKKEEYNTRRGDRKKKKETVELPKITFPKGAILVFTGVGEDQMLTREEIKAKIEEVTELTPAYIDYAKQDKNGYVRMGEENGAKKVFEKFPEGILEIGDVKLNFTILEGDEEDKYLKQTIEVMVKKRQNQKAGRRKRKGNGFDRSSSKRSKRDH